MKKLIIFFLFIMLPFAVHAQVRFGYLSYSEAIKTMPDYAIIQKNISSLKAQYDNEIKRAEDEFNLKYEQFLEGQRSFAPSIMKKRQSELQELLDRNVAFKKDADRLLRQAEDDMYGPLRQKLDAVLRKIGQERGYAFILNTDNNALPFVSQAYGEDITEVVKSEM